MIFPLKKRNGTTESEEIEIDELGIVAEGSASGGSLSENEDYEDTSGDIGLEEEQRVRGISSGGGSRKHLGRPNKQGWGRIVRIEIQTYIHWKVTCVPPSI